MTDPVTYLFVEDHEYALFDGFYYKLTTTNSNYKVFSRGPSKKNKHHTLQRAVYEKFYGEIPKRHVIHHVDGNSHNNDPKNLQCLTPSQHTILHSKNKKLWLKTEEGALWRLQQNKIGALSPRLSFSKNCAFCSEKFMAYHSNQKFCSKKCCNKARNASDYRKGKGHHFYLLELARQKDPRVCPLCGKTFYTLPNKKKKYCSLQCFNKTKRKVKN